MRVLTAPDEAPEGFVPLNKRLSADSSARFGPDSNSMTDTFADLVITSVQWERHYNKGIGPLLVCFYYHNDRVGSK